MNGYNEISREGVLSAIKKQSSLRNMIAFNHALMQPSTYIGMGNATSLATESFCCKEGVHNYAIENGWYFSII